MNADVQTVVTVEANADLTQWGLAALDSATFWMPVAFIAALCFIQIIKMGLKLINPPKYKHLRKLATFVIAYIVGFNVGVYFLDGADSHKWASFIGFTNPFVYIGLKSFARKRKIAWLMSIMKMRDVSFTKEGELSYDDTQVIMVKK